MCVVSDDGICICLCGEYGEYIVFRVDVERFVRVFASFDLCNLMFEGV